MANSATSSRFVIEAARPEDDAELRGAGFFLRQMPMGQAIEVTFEREPSFFRAAAIQGRHVQVFLGRLNGRIIGLGTRAIRPTTSTEMAEAGYLPICVSCQSSAAAHTWPAPTDSCESCTKTAESKFIAR